VQLPDLDFEGVMPDGFVPMEAVLLLQGLNADGDDDVVLRATTGMSSYTAIGLLEHCKDVLRHALLEED